MLLSSRLGGVDILLGLRKGDRGVMEGHGKHLCRRTEDSRGHCVGECGKFGILKVAKSMVCDCDRSCVLRAETAEIVIILACRDCDIRHAA